ncbi:Outer membrane protein Slp [uncultured bacterium]|nr:Outer membrane protein Slp [uncultured bacterium]
MRRLFLIFAAMLMISGCSVVPKSILKEVNRDISLDQVQSNPAQYTGQKVLWGGIILNSENLENYTQIEVLETELAYDERPEDGTSRGRFLIQSPGYLDTNIYTKNKRITIAGTVKGVETGKIGKMDYRYPVIEPIDMRTFEQMTERDYDYPYSPYMYGPYYPYSPFYPYGPFSPYGPYRHPFYPYPYPFP